MRHRNAGFTLIELAAAISVASILAGIAIPSLQDALHASRGGAAKAALVESWMTSVSHAANTGTEVVLCPGNTGGCLVSTDWSKGWIAFADLDGNRTRSPNETLLKETPPLENKVHMISTAGRTRLVLQPSGGNAGSNVTWTLCDGRGAEHASTVVLANHGRLRTGTPTATAAQNCASAN